MFLGGAFQRGRIKEKLVNRDFPALFSYLERAHYENYSVYLEDRFSILKKLFVECGVEYDWFRFGIPHRYGWDKALPKLGITYKNLLGTLRASYIQSIQPYVVSGSIRPMDFAGFYPYVGLPTGTKMWQYAFGWDREWGERVFTRLEWYRRKYSYPYQGYYGYALKDTVEKGFNAFLDAIPWKYMGISFEYKYRDLDFDYTGRSRYDNEFGVRFTFTHPSFTRMELAYWYVDQDPGDSFSIWSFTVEKYLFDKTVSILFRVENILDENFWYQPRTSTEAFQLPWQERHAYLELKFNF